MRNLISIIVLSLLSPLAFGASVILEIRHLWEGELLEIPSGKLKTAANEEIDVSRLAYLISQPALEGDDGKRIGRNDWFAYIDATNPVSRLTLSGVPKGGYRKIQFTIGLDEKANHSDPNQYSADHPLNPLVNNLHWSPQGGYIFFAIEGHSSPLAFSWHLGNTGNYVNCEVPVALDLQSDVVVSLDFHLDRFFNRGEAPLSTQNQTSTHSREGDPLIDRMKAGLVDIFSLRGVSYGQIPLTSEKKRGEVNLVGTPYRFKLRKGFPVPQLPTDYPLTNERVSLGNQLFHDPLLSRNGKVSCSSCHKEENAFADPNRYSVGVEEREGTRNSMSLMNLAWKRDSFFWDGRASSLREQTLIPIEDHLEMDETLENVVAKLSGHSEYAQSFKSAFGDSEISAERIAIAIEQFVLTLTSFDSKFDRASRGEDSLTDIEKRGFQLFMTEFDPRSGIHGADCFHCHDGAFFTNHRFHNNGLKAGVDIGLAEVTSKDSDRNKFVTPSLRNVEITGPYMHDGRFDTLEEVVAHYASGVERSATLDPNLSKHPNGGIPLGKEDQAALVAFLKTLTDNRFKSSESVALAN